MESKLLSIRNMKSIVHKFCKISPIQKIFAVYGHVEILDAPNWLEAFREKYNTQYDCQVTLKQPCYFQERQLQDIKNSIRKALVGFDLPDNQLSLHFDSLRAD